jgi:hypothetical protein
MRSNQLITANRAGIATSSFPNLLLLNGPNTVAPWASIISGIELQAIYNAQIVREIKSRCNNRKRFALAPKPEVEVEYTETLQAELETLATSTKFGERYYYLSAKGRNTFFYPYTQKHYKSLLGRVDWDKYTTREQDDGE